MQHIPAEGFHVAVLGQRSTSIPDRTASELSEPLSWRHAAQTDHVHRRMNVLIVLLHKPLAVPETCSFR